MEGAMLSSQSNTRFRSHLKNAASVFCARTLPKQRQNDVVSPARHHTYPRVSSHQKRAKIPCRLEPLICANELVESTESSPQQDTEQNFEFRGAMAREVASVWGSHVGPPQMPAPADRVQGLFNEIHLFPTKTQVFEMLVCARQCVWRKALTLTFGEFCVFAAELRLYSRQAKLESNNPESPQLGILKRYQEKAAKYFNGSEASSPPYEIFLGGSCNPTTWRSDIAIPMLKQLGITYFNPQVEDWSTELMEVEDRAKAAAQALLFVLDRETRAVAASVEAAHHATAPRDLLLVLRPYVRHQKIGQETLSDHEYLELSRARATLQELVERRGRPVFTDIRAALKCAHAVLRRTSPRRQLGQTILRLKRSYDAAGGRTSSLTRSKAVGALCDVTKASRELADRCLPKNLEHVDFETFCATVAEMFNEAALERGVVPDAARGSLAQRMRRALCGLRDRFVTDYHHRVTNENTSESTADAARADSGLHACNARLRAYGRKLRLFIPKNGSNRESPEASPVTAADSVLTPGTERRLERLPAMLDTPHTPHVPRADVYLGGRFPMEGPAPEEVLKREGYTFAKPRPNDYTRLFSVPSRRPAPDHPDSPKIDKKPRASPPSHMPSRSQTPPTTYSVESDHLASPSRASPPHAASPSPSNSAYVPSPSRAHPSDVPPRSPTRASPPHASTPTDAATEEVQFREHSESLTTEDRLSASDFYTVSEDVTPQPFKGTYDEELILGSRVLLFSLSAREPSFAGMVLAAHYMGLRPRHTVLLVQPMSPDHPHYSAAAIKDYNRGRHYLADLAQRAGVPVCRTPDAALAAVLDKLRTPPTPTPL